MCRKVQLQVFATNAPAKTRQPAEYICDVQSVEVVPTDITPDTSASTGYEMTPPDMLSNAIAALSATPQGAPAVSELQCLTSDEVGEMLEHFVRYL